MSPTNLFWDSCCFIRYLTGSENDACFDDICQFVEDAKAKKVSIHYSTVAFAEIRPRHLKQGRFGSINEMLEDFGSSFVPIEASPNVLIWAGSLKDAQATNPGDPKQPPERVRVFGTPDAIHLASCIYARDTLGIGDIVFHTLDEGKGPSWEGKCIPLLGLERWFPNPRGPLIEKVCGLARSKPSHPRPMFKGIIANGRAIELGTSDSGK